MVIYNKENISYRWTVLTLGVSAQLSSVIASLRMMNEVINVRKKRCQKQKMYINCLCER